MATGKQREKAQLGRLLYFRIRQPQPELIGILGNIIPPLCIKGSKFVLGDDLSCLQRQNQEQTIIQPNVMPGNYGLIDSIL